MDDKRFTTDFLFTLLVQSSLIGPIAFKDPYLSLLSLIGSNNRPCVLSNYYNNNFDLLCIINVYKRDYSILFTERRLSRLGSTSQ